MSANIRKIAILYSKLSGYAAAAQRALKEAYPVELLVFHWPVTSNAPFNNSIFAHIDHRHEKKGFSRQQIIDTVHQFQPDVLLISGWMDNDYLAVGRFFKKKGIPVIAGSDTQWNGSWRQKIGKIIAPWYLHTAIDVLWVTGERQRQLANYLGFRGPKCWQGFYTCNWSSFALKKQRLPEEARPAFIYTGRLIPRKGINTLIQAYQLYRQSIKNPWDLIVVGSGRLKPTLQEIPGVELPGFIQPDALPTLLQSVKAFVLPSLVEPWGVALHEAATAGLPLISSDASGATVHLLQDGYNGFLFEKGNVQQLTNCFLKMTELTAEEWAKMSQGSFELSKQFTPQKWAKTLIAGLER